MADAYWRYADGRATTAAIHAPPPGSVKRPRSDYPDISGGPDFRGYYPHEEERVGHRVAQDTESIEASYERYLRNGMSSYSAGDSGRPYTGGMTSRPVDDPRMMVVGSVDSRNVGYGGGRPELSRRPEISLPYTGGMTSRPVDDPRMMVVGSVDSQNVGYGGGRPELSRRPEISLPADASSTLFVEGLPANCSRREVSHIFRPFVGFREVRLVNKESRNPGNDPLVLCFVDFSNPSQAAIALDALQGYKFDEHDRDSASLRLQFARFPGPRSAGGPRGRR